MPSPADSARYLRLHRAWLASLDPEHQAALAPLPDPDPAWGHMGLVPSPASILAPSTLNDDPAIRAMLASIEKNGNDGEDACHPLIDKLRQLESGQGLQLAGQSHQEDGEEPQDSDLEKEQHCDAVL